MKLRALVLSLTCAASIALAGAMPAAQAPYRILLTNDDGVRAPGLLAMAQALKAVGEVTIVAPAENQSGKGHSISITDPVYVDEVTLAGGLQALGATATPASCVKLAVLTLMPVKPDLVVSGINRGSNVGVVSYVSGTVGAAREAALQGIPAIATSMSIEGGWSDYSHAAEATAKIAAQVKAQGLAPRAFLNVNVPAGVPKGIKLATQSAQAGDESWVEQRNPRGRRYFWNEYREPTSDPDAATDVAVMAQGYVAVVPLKATEYDAASRFKLPQ